MKNKGFSLVELIVVIAIMAILVGVAVPVYTGYIQDAKEAKDAQYLDDLAHAAQIFSAEQGVELQSILIAPEVTDSQGIVLYTKDGKAFDGDLSKLYAIVGAYDFETLESDEVIYFTPAVENEGTNADCQHEQTETVPATCIEQGYTHCLSCDKVFDVIDLSAHSFSTQNVGNLIIKRCDTCGHAEYTFTGDSLSGQ